MPMARAAHVGLRGKPQPPSPLRDTGAMRSLPGGPTCHNQPRAPHCFTFLCFLTEKGRTRRAALRRISLLGFEHLAPVCPRRPSEPARPTGPDRNAPRRGRFALPRRAHLPCTRLSPTTPHYRFLGLEGEDGTGVSARHYQLGPAAPLGALDHPIGADVEDGRRSTSPRAAAYKNDTLGL